MVPGKTNPFNIKNNFNRKLHKAMTEYAKTWSKFLGN